MTPLRTALHPQDCDPFTVVWNLTLQQARADAIWLLTFGTSNQDPYWLSPDLLQQWLVGLDQRVSTRRSRRR